jgi:hypothetical protein
MNQLDIATLLAKSEEIVKLTNQQPVVNSYDVVYSTELINAVRSVEDLFIRFSHIMTSIEHNLVTCKTRLANGKKKQLTHPPSGTHKNVATQNIGDNKRIVSAKCVDNIQDIENDHPLSFYYTEDPLSYKNKHMRHIGNNPEIEKKLITSEEKHRWKQQTMHDLLITLLLS